MIEVKNLAFRYGDEKEDALKGVNLEIREGSYLGIIGPNGCGKTTLIKHFNGLLLPTKGEVWVDGLNTREPKALRKIRQKIGMIFQNPDYQIVGMSVEEDVAFGPGNLGLPPEEIQERVKESLSQAGLSDFAMRAPHTLSGGEKQLLAIAGVLAMRPSYIVCDEPTTYLDPAGKKRVLGVLRELHRKGICLIHITHDMDEVVEAEEVIVMHEGRILLKDRPSAVFQRWEWLKEHQLEPPRIAELVWRLRQVGVDLPSHILDLDEAVAEIGTLVHKGGKGLGSMG